MIDKNAVARCFGKAAASYDQHAILQRLSSDRLLQYLPGTPSPSNKGVAIRYNTTIDLGCGSGALLPTLGNCSNQLFAVDLSFGMLAHAKQQVYRQQERQEPRQTNQHELHPLQDKLTPPLYWLNADAEALPLQSGSVDLCVSNLALQWCDDLATPLIEASRCLKQGGLMLFSTLVSGSLDELTQSWSSVNEHRHVNRFLSEGEIKAALLKSGLSVETFQVEIQTMYYSSVKEVMQSLKGIGANHVHDKDAKPTTQGELRAFKANYETLRDNQGLLPLSYKLAYCLLRKC
ncbi:malonyl-ACP O-methyltransferase BioC [Moritella marina ATCC 15381]|uniref:Malonyl-[acyl-carrier protein] O-methyltransferase n=1 Tax=Moritella marina ATCC 15381 TaxID=1202962 RepID=A0A5J6WI65_MORMI|nr:malonyl-ACP O-methyltransferase BioC [Moritella marina]QFI37756.1 malonyl-ACP O-methyltransferase BioC [Moritella marina ATCC 15381]